tara:strand:+ start:5743 stop:6630 length:888 start_codon:yes stop_codon:yes gene_type:complete
MIVTNNFNLPDVVVSALTQDDYTKGKSNRSVTQLIDSPQIAILARENADDIKQDAVDFLWSRFGTSVHTMFEKAAEGADQVISEERMFAEVLGWTISGAVDLQELSDRGRIVSDYKVTSVWSVIFAKKEWHNQLNCYAWLIRKSHGAVVKQLRIIAIIRDWQRRRASEDSTYPQSPIKIIEIPLWSDEEQDAYVEGRVRLHQEAEFKRLTGGDIEPCTQAETWKKDDSYAVVKKGRKRAVRVLGSQQDADEFMDAIAIEPEKHSVEVRRGEATRCIQDWCRVSKWCPQFTGEYCS